MANNKWKEPFRWYEARCPHCQQRHNLSEFDGWDPRDKAKFICEFPENDARNGCGGAFVVPKSENTTLVWVEPVDRHYRVNG